MTFECNCFVNPYNGTECSSGSHAPWCPACRSLESIWQNIAGWCTDIDIRIGQVAVATNPGIDRCGVSGSKAAPPAYLYI